MRGSLVICLVFLLLVGVVNAIGVTYPLPSVLELERGEGGRFWFQIQNTEGKETIHCTYTISGLDLEWEFDNIKGVDIKIGAVSDVYGSIIVPSQATFGEYDGTVKVDCYSPEVLENVTGGKIVKGFNVPIKVSVVEVRTQENMPLPAKPSPFWDFLNAYHWHIISVCSVVIAGSICYYYIFRSRRAKSEIPVCN